VSNDDNFLLWPLNQPLASFLGSLRDCLFFRGPFALLDVPPGQDKGEIDRVAAEHVGQFSRFRASVAGEATGLLQFWESDDLESSVLDVVLEAEQCGV